MSPEVVICPENDQLLDLLLQEDLKNIEFTRLFCKGPFVVFDETELGIEEVLFL